MNRTWQLLLFLCVLLLMVGCTSKVYKDSMKQGSILMLEEKYDQAAASFAEALLEEPEDEQAVKALEEAKSALSIQESIIKSEADIEKKNYPAAIKTLDKLVSTVAVGETDQKLVDEAKALLEDVNERIAENIKQLDDTYFHAQKAFDAKHYDVVVKALEQTKDIPHPSKEEQEAIDKIQTVVNQALYGYWTDHFGNWLTIEIDENPWCDGWGDCYPGYEALEIIEVKDNTIRFELISGGHRIASTEVVAFIQDDGHVGFTFTDSWNNKGTGSMTAKEDIITVTIDTIKMDELANWSISEGTRDFYKTDSAEVVDARIKQDEIVADKEEEWQLAEEERKQQELAERKTKGITIGMTKDEVLMSNWGEPHKVNTTISARGTSEQWVYPNYQYLYFDDGILTNIQQ
jgi:tetratricopeptide (TPR) repeat protein